MTKSYSEITPQIHSLAEKSKRNNGITTEMYVENNVKRGLRDQNGNGVVTGLTEISSIISKKKNADGEVVPCGGELYYRGIDVKELSEGFLREKRFGFEETVYLLLFSELPDKDELEEFKQIIADYRSLPPSFVRDMILKAPSRDMMNILSRSVLALYSYDENPDDISVDNVLRQSLQLISMFPLLAVYGYHGYRHYHLNKSLHIRNPKPELSTAENLLHILRKDGSFTSLEARVLDLALVLHAEHGGGNNSSFTTHVVTSSGTDTYSTIAAAMASLKGPKHGGANIKVMEMMDDIRKNVNDWEDREEVKTYLGRMLDGEVFDKKGLIYGMGHAVYSLSDPRERIFKGYVEELAVAKGQDKQMHLYNLIEELAPELIAEKRHIYKGVSPNVDFYSGFVYEMLDIPQELYTPLFAIARIVGWSAHRIEEMIGMNKIIRPAYKSIMEEVE